MTKEVVRHFSPLPGELPMWISIKYPHVPRMFMPKRVPYEIQEAVADSLDFKIKPAMHDHRLFQGPKKNSEDIVYPDFSHDNLRDMATEMIKHLKSDLLSPALPYKTLGARLNYFKKVINEKRRSDRIVDIAYLMSREVAINYLIGPQDRRLTSREQRMVNNCGYYTSWNILRIQNEANFLRGKNPFESILTLHALGIKDLRFVRGHSDEKIVAFMPSESGDTPSRIAA